MFKKQQYKKNHLRFLIVGTITIFNDNDILQHLRRMKVHYVSLIQIWIQIPVENFQCL